MERWPHLFPIIEKLVFYIRDARILLSPWGTNGLWAYYIHEAFPLSFTAFPLHLQWQCIHVPLFLHSSGPPQSSPFFFPSGSLFPGLRFTDLSQTQTQLSLNWRWTSQLTQPFPSLWDSESSLSFLVSYFHESGLLLGHRVMRRFSSISSFEGNVLLKSKPGFS